MTRVRHSLLICFVARSGSWHLCGLLASTGVLGRPEEFFWAPDDRVREARPQDVLPSGTTPNGVFACKFQLGQWQEVMRREDALAQAVSWSRAMQTGRWSATEPAEGEAAYDRAQIEGLVELIGEETDDWRRWFAAAAAGVELPDGVELRPYPGRERQADALDEEWIARFREGAPA